MKITKLLSLLAALMIFASANAQISIGVRVGANFANQNFDADGLSISPDGLTGLAFGIPIEIGITESFAVQPELNFIQKGSSIEFSDEIFGETFESKTDTRINYIEIPILAKVKFGTETIDAYLAAGPTIGFGMSGKVETEVTAAGVTESAEEDIDFDEDGIKRSDIGLSIGAGAGIAAGPGSLFLDLRYVLGLSNISDNDGVPDDEQVDVTNRGFQVSIGYLFPLGGE